MFGCKSTYTIICFLGLFFFNALLRLLFVVLIRTGQSKNPVSTTSLHWQIICFWTVRSRFSFTGNGYSCLLSFSLLRKNPEVYPEPDAILRKQLYSSIDALLTFTDLGSCTPPSWVRKRSSAPPPSLPPLPFSPHTGFRVNPFLLIVPCFTTTTTVRRRSGPTADSSTALLVLHQAQRPASSLEGAQLCVRQDLCAVRGPGVPAPVQGRTGSRFQSAAFSVGLVFVCFLFVCLFNPLALM